MIRYLATYLFGAPVPLWAVVALIVMTAAASGMIGLRSGEGSVECPPPPVLTCPPPVVPECPPVVRQPDFGGRDGDECPECVCRSLDDAVRWLEQRAGAGDAGE
jgi:hypothetical protein